MTQTMPGPGDQAPDFSLDASGGKTVSLGDYTGNKNVVLYFYPKDDTSGCTAEACGFRDINDQFGEADTVVLGVSGDDVASKDAFASKYGLPFPLLADPDFDVSGRYGVYRQRERNGKTFMGIVRTTFLIDKQGVVRKVYPEISVEEHADEVLQDVAAL